MMSQIALVGSPIKAFHTSTCSTEILPPSNSVSRLTRVSGFGSKLVIYQSSEWMKKVYDFA